MVIRGWFLLDGLIQLQDDTPQGRQGELNGVRPVHPVHILRGDFAQVSQVAAGVICRIGIKHFPETA